MTEIALLRFASVPSALVQEIRFHAIGCPTCIRADGNAISIDTRRCAIAHSMVERCVNFEAAKRHPEGTR